MEVVGLDIPDVRLIRPRQHADERGFFSEIYNRQLLFEHGIAMDFVQDNFSYSAEIGTVRGLHFQRQPQAQAKLVMVLKGRVFDVVVDCRPGSPTYGSHVSIELSSEAWNQLFVPPGLAHGFCTLEPGTAVLYKVSAPYAPALDGGILWNDPELGIAWPVAPDRAIVSEKDRRLPNFREVAERPLFASEP
jgi:dTDP-4-dehydrorhamnose 3,5-epimerase